MDGKLNAIEFTQLNGNKLEVRKKNYVVFFCFLEKVRKDRVSGKHITYTNVPSN